MFSSCPLIGTRIKTCKHFTQEWIIKEFHSIIMKCLPEFTSSRSPANISLQNEIHSAEKYWPQVNDQFQDEGPVALVHRQVINAQMPPVTHVLKCQMHESYNFYSERYMNPIKGSNSPTKQMREGSTFLAFEPLTQENPLWLIANGQWANACGLSDLWLWKQPYLTYTKLDTSHQRQVLYDTCC